MERQRRGVRVELGGRGQGGAQPAPRSEPGQGHDDRPALRGAGRATLGADEQEAGLAVRREDRRLDLREDRPRGAGADLVQRAGGHLGERLSAVSDRTGSACAFAGSFSFSVDRETATAPAATAPITIAAKVSRTTILRVRCGSGGRRDAAPGGGGLLGRLALAARGLITRGILRGTGNPPPGPGGRPPRPARGRSSAAARSCPASALAFRGPRWADSAFGCSARARSDGSSSFGLARCVAMDCSPSPRERRERYRQEPAPRAGVLCERVPRSADPALAWRCTCSRWCSSSPAVRCRTGSSCVRRPAMVAASATPSSGPGFGVFVIGVWFWLARDAVRAAARGGRRPLPARGGAAPAPAEPVGRRARRRRPPAAAEHGGAARRGGSRCDRRGPDGGR